MIDLNDTGVNQTETDKGVGRIWSIDRQVRLLSGSLVLVGIALGCFLHPNWLILSVLVSLGMVISAVNGSCTLGAILLLLPWNRRQAH